MARIISRLIGVCVLCTSLMLTTSAYSYVVVPGHDYRIDLLTTNFMGSVVSLSYPALTLSHQPAFVESPHLTLDQPSVPPGQTVVIHLVFRIAEGSWGQSDTLRALVQFDTTFQVQPPNWPLDIPLDVVASCSVSCGGISEGEPYLAGPDLVNGGCNSVPPVFSNIAVGDTICGTGFTFYLAPYNRRDTDWYEFACDTTMSFIWEVEAEFPVQTFIADGSLGCDAPGFILATEADSCGMATLETGCLPAGTYWFFLAPLYYTGIPEPKPYRAVLSGGACEYDDPCLAFEELHCQQIVTGNNAAGTNSWATYPLCGGYFETGPEKVYHISILYDGTQITAAMSGLSADLDVFLLDDCDPRACIGGANDTLSLMLDQGSYYLVLDGYLGAVSNYALSLTCDIPEPPPPEIVIQRLDSADVELSWLYAEPVDSFYIYRDSDPDFVPSPSSFLGATDSLSFVDPDVLGTPGPNYFYKVTAVRVPARRDVLTGARGLVRPIQVNYDWRQLR